METIAKDFFEELFTTKGRDNEMSSIQSGVNKCITKNTKLTAPYTEEEVFGALKDMGPTKAPSINGFPTIFFQKYWHIVINDVCLFCLGALNNGMNLETMNVTT